MCYTKLVKCYVSLYEKIANQHSVEKNSASVRTQSIIDDLKDCIKKRKRKIEELIKERNEFCEKLDRNDEDYCEKKNEADEKYREKIENILNDEIYSNFDTFQDLKIIKKPKIYNIYKVIKLNLKQKDNDFEIFDTTPQVKYYFHFLYNMQISGLPSGWRLNRLCISRNVVYYFVNIKEANFSLSGFDFTGCYFFNCCLSGLLQNELYGTNFNKTKFDHCDFSNATFGYNSQFYDAELSYTNFSKSKFHNCYFGYKDYNLEQKYLYLQKNDLRRRIDDLLRTTQFVDGYFKQYMHIQDLKLETKQLHESTTYSTNLAHCDFTSVSFVQCNFKHCDLECTKFDKATFNYHGSSFSACNLAGADFSNCIFEPDEKTISIFDSQECQIEVFKSVEPSFFTIWKCIKHYKGQGFKLDKIKFYEIKKNNSKFTYSIVDNLEPLEIPVGREEYYEIKDIDKEVLKETFENLRNKLKEALEETVEKNLRNKLEEAENNKNNDVREWSENGITLKYSEEKRRYFFYVDTKYYIDPYEDVTITFDEFDKLKDKIHDCMRSDDTSDYYFVFVLPNYYTTKPYEKRNPQTREMETIPATKFPEGFDPTKCKGLVEVKIEEDGELLPVK